MLYHNTVTITLTTKRRRKEAAISSICVCGARSSSDSNWSRRFLPKAGVICDREADKFYYNVRRDDGG
jgi:hypothetical protein